MVRRSLLIMALLGFIGLGNIANAQVVAYSEDFEGSENDWYNYTANVCSSCPTGVTGPTTATTDATDNSHSGSESLKAANSNHGACGIAGVAKDFNLGSPADSLSLWVKATTANWGRVSIAIKDPDSTDHDVIWENKSGGYPSLNMPWTKLAFDLSGFGTEFTLIIGNADMSDPHCDNGDHYWDIWADDIEITTVCNTPPSFAFNVPDTVYYNAKTDLNIIANPGNVYASYEWFLNGQSLAQQKSFEYSNFTDTLDQDTLMATASHCFGVDTLTKYVMTAVQQKEPIAKFIASKNRVFTGTEVNFEDLSKQGPTSWQWEISPKFTGSGDTTYKNLMNPGILDLTNNDPNIEFKKPGSYDVCLYASNVEGTDTLCKTDYIKVWKRNLMCSGNQSFNESQGYLFDNGGSGNYTDQNCFSSIQPCGDSIRLEFEQFNLEPNDFLQIYDGPPSTGKKLWDVQNYSSNGLTGNISNSDFDTVLWATSGQAYFSFTSGGGNNAPGYRIKWEAKGGTSTNPPVASFKGPDTACPNNDVTFINNSTEKSLTNYEWFTGNGNSLSNDKNLSHQFSSPGSRTINLIASNCGGADTFSKELYVKQGSTNTPVAGFYADQRNVVADKTIVNLYDTSNNCVSSRTWSFIPDSVTYMNGTDQNSPNPQVQFDLKTCYQVVLEVNNSSGTALDTSQACYIEGINYCDPLVGNNAHSDIGISKVNVGDINYQSQTGLSNYHDFTNNSTLLEKGDTNNVTVERHTTKNAINRGVWIDFNQDGDFDEPNELVANESNTKTIAMNDQFTVPYSASNGATRMRVVAAYKNNSLTPCGPVNYGEYEDYTVVIQEDKTKPIINLSGPDTVKFEACKGGGQLNLGYMATDNVDGNITSNVAVNSNVNVKEPGSYEKTYTVFDNAGNKGQKVRTYIVEPDETEPSALLNGNKEVTTQAGKVYQDPGVTVSDNCAGIDTVVVTNPVDTTAIGIYTISYKIYDNEANMSVKTRNVEVLDNRKPTIVLNGKDTVTHSIGTPYNDPGAIYKDNYWDSTAITSKVQGQVSKDEIGTYTLTYQAEDGSGNIAIKKRIVEVVDHQSPTISSPYYAHNDTIMVNINNQINPGIQVTDNHRDDLIKTVKKGSYFENAVGIGEVAKEIGVYQAIYKYTDVSGNSDSIGFYVHVVDGQAPQFDLRGSKSVNIDQWNTYPLAKADTGVKNIQDDYYSEDEISVNTSGSYFSAYIASNKKATGTFDIVYQVSDPSGNLRTKSKLVNVIESTGLEETEAKQNIFVYPNPTNGELTIEISQNMVPQGKILITNSLGKVMRSIPKDEFNGQQYHLNMKKWDAGLYFIKLETGNEVFIKQVILTR